MSRKSRPHPFFKKLNFSSPWTSTLQESIDQPSFWRGELKEILMLNFLPSKNPFPKSSTFNWKFESPTNWSRLTSLACNWDLLLSYEEALNPPQFVRKLRSLHLKPSSITTADRSWGRELDWMLWISYSHLSGISRLLRILTPWILCINVTRTVRKVSLSIVCNELTAQSSRPIVSFLQPFFKVSLVGFELQ